MRVVTTSLEGLWMIPVLLLAAIAFGPVALAVLCAVGFGLIVFVLVNIAFGAAVVSRSVEHAVARRTHRASR
jgi:uncharacterized protein (DUF58 family)